MKLALAIIAKNEVEEVQRILSDYASIFDEIHVAVDQRLDEFEALKGSWPTLHIHPYTWINDFSHKRNFLASKITCDYYFVLDTDDAIVNPQEVRRTFEEAAKQDIGVVYVQYDYAHDADGNVTARHRRAAIVKNTPNLIWEKTIHETLHVKDTTCHRFVMDDSFRIKHLKSQEAYMDSMVRNVEFLLAEFKRDGEATDPRTIAYIGRGLLGIGEYQKAKFFLVKHITKSGWDEDRYISRCQLAECHLQLKEMEEARLCAMEATLEMPTYPDAYLKLHEIYFEEGNWQKAIYWGEEAAKHKFPDDSVMMVDPSSYTWRPAITLAYSYFETDQFDKALALFNYAKKLAPSCSFIKNNEKMFTSAVEERNFAEKFIYLAQYLKTREPHKLKTLFETIPSDMEDNVYISNARNKLLPPKVWDKDSIVIYCGPVLDEWADPSVVTGIGGSEEAVIYLSREFAKLGKKVTVFNGCGTMEGEYNGVTYLNYQKFNPRDTFDTLIAWRVSIFGFPIKARQRWVWFHDVMPTKGLLESHISSIDKVVVLSQFHRTLLPTFVPDEKILVSTNGINPEDFIDTGVKRDHQRLIYASSYDRGLEHLLEVWPQVREAVPGATLEIFYGWNNIDKLIKQGDGNLLAFKKKMVALLQQPGVHENGRIGHKKLIKEYQKSGIYAYPCSYEEISCISAMKAQACGCIPVTTDFAALSETVQSGIKVAGKGGTNNEAYLAALLSVLCDDEYATNEHKPPTWERVAKEWVSFLA